MHLHRPHEPYSIKSVRGGAGAHLLEAEFVNHRYERNFHDELVLAVTESGTARINCWGQRIFRSKRANPAFPSQSGRDSAAISGCRAGLGAYCTS
jgi:hypothetical protein